MASNKFYIPAGSLIISPNNYGNPNLISVSVLSKSTITYYTGDADGVTQPDNASYPCWTFIPYNVLLSDNLLYNVYAKCSKTSTIAYIYFSPTTKNLTTEPDFYYIPIGSVTAVADNLRTFIPDFGIMLTDKGGAIVEVSSDLNKMFTLNKPDERDDTTWFIDVLRKIKSLKVTESVEIGENLTVTGIGTFSGLKLKDKVINDFILANDTVEGAFTDSQVMTALRTDNELKAILNKCLRKDVPDTASELITFLSGLVSEAVAQLKKGVSIGDFIKSMTAGKGAGIDEGGNAQFESLEVRSYLKVLELIYNRLTALEGDYTFTDFGTIDAVEDLGENTYKMTMRKRWDTDFTSMHTNDVIYGIVNSIVNGSGSEIYTSWMRVLSVDTTANTITAVVYPDTEVPSGHNFAPAVSMNITRRGNSDSPTDGSHNGRQDSWLLSSTEGQILFLENVYKPVLEEYNYALSIGKLPDLEIFKNIPVGTNDMCLYAKNVIAQNYYKVDANGIVSANEIFRGKWNLEVAQGTVPYRRIVHEVTSGTETVVNVLEVHTVYHNGYKWACLIDKTTEEPKWNSTGWQFLEGNDSYGIELSKESHTIACDSTGTPKTGEVGADGKAWTKVSLYKGGTLLTYGTDWSFGDLVVSGVTASKTAQAGGYIHIMSVTDASGYVDIPVIVNGEVVATKRFSITRTKDGINGYSASYVTVTGSQVFKYAKGATVPSNENIVLTANRFNIPLPTYTWKYYNESTSTWTQLTGSNATLTFNYTSMTYASANHDSIRIRCLVNGNYDEITIVKLYDGSDAVTIILSNESHTVACASDGVPKDGEVGTDGKAWTQVLVYKGIVSLTYGTDWSFGDLSVSGLSASKTVINGGYVHVITMYSDSGYVDIPVIVGGTTIATKRFSLTKSKDGVAGSNAKSIKITGSQVFRYASGATVPENQSIVLTATLQNSADYNWGKVVDGVFTAFSPAITTSQVNILYTALGTSNSLTVRCYTANNTLYDEITLVKLFDGKDSISVILTNETHTVSCGSDGVAKAGELGSSGKAITKILVYRGTTLLTYGSDKDWTYGTLADTNVTHGTSTDSVYINTITADSGYVDIPIVIGAVTITKRFSLTKSKDGGTGSGAISITVTGEQFFRFVKGATSPTNSTVRLTATLQNSADYSWGTVVNGVFTAAGIFGSTWDFPYSLMGAATSIIVRCKTASVYYDDIQIVCLKDGNDSISVILTNETHTVSCDNEGAAKAGELGSTGKAITKILVYRGTTLLTYGSDKDWTYGTLADTNVTHGTSTDSVYINTITADSGYVDIPIVIGSVTITKRFSLTKSKDGGAGTAAYSMALSKESHLVACDSSGNPKTGELALANTLISVYKGDILLTLGTDWTIDEFVSDGASFTYTGNNFKLVSFDAGAISGYCDITIMLIPQEQYITKRFTVTRSIETPTPFSTGEAWSSGVTFRNGQYLYDEGKVYMWSYFVSGNSTLSPKNDVATNPSTTHWKVYENWSLLATQILLAEFGKIASAVFSGNYMMSQQGSILVPIFIRSASQPSTPTGGTYTQPVPSGWSNAIPSGTSNLYYSMRRFNADGASQDAAWTTPVLMATTSSIKFLFSSVASPVSPNTSTAEWSSSIIVGAKWFAVSTYTSGAWTAYTVYKVMSTFGYENFTGSTLNNSPFIPNYFVNFLTGNVRATSGIFGLLQLIAGSVIGRDTSGIERIRFSSEGVPALANLFSSWESISDGASESFNGRITTASDGSFIGYSNSIEVDSPVFTLASAGSIKIINASLALDYDSNLEINYFNTQKITILDNHLNVVCGPSTNLTGAINLSAGTYFARYSVDITISGIGAPNQLYVIKQTPSFDGIELQKASERTMIGSNGFYSMFGADSYVYFKQGVGLVSKGNTDMPGVLASGSISSTGSQDSAKIWGAKASSTPATLMSTGHYRVPINATNANYTVSISPRASQRTFYIGTCASTYFDVYFYSGSTLVNTAFDFQIIGTNA